MKPNRSFSLASDDEARDDEILRRHGSHADDADAAAPRERMALARTRLRDDGDGDERGPARHGRADGRRSSARR